MATTKGGLVSRQRVWETPNGPLCDNEAMWLLTFLRLYLIKAKFLRVESRGLVLRLD